MAVENFIMKNYIHFTVFQISLFIKSRSVARVGHLASVLVDKNILVGESVWKGHFGDFNLKGGQY